MGEFMNYVTNIHKVNTDKVSTLIEASIQAYNAFDDENPTICQCSLVTPPKNFEFVTCWSGVDSLFGKDKSEEIFGVVFRSLQAPYTYIFAFRGTASILDGLDDLGVEKTHFKAFNKRASVPNEVEVEAGFYDIYTQEKPWVSPMQSQLFALIDEYQKSDKPMNELWITGHSLGSSLCELFSLDVKLSRPDIRATNMNFACPRTGNQAFVDFYESTLKPHNTLRVQNTYDIVPCVPPEKLGYAHLPWALLVAFYEEKWIDRDNLVARHSALNYQAVINCAIQSTEGTCSNHSLYVPGNGYHITSKTPNTGTVCGLFKK
jgi:triacylglycerol lipase